MLYIFNKIISNSNNIINSLTILYGINRYQSKKICRSLGINPQITINQIKNNHVNRLINYLNNNIKVEQLLKKEKKSALSELLGIKLNRAIRQSQGLPARGQRSHTNAKTVRKFKSKSISKSKYKKN